MKTKSDVGEVQKQIEKIQAQKSQLIKQIGILEDKLNQSDQFYKRALSLFTDLVKIDQNNSLFSVLKTFKSKLSQNSELNDIETEFNKLRTALIQDDVLIDLSETPEPSGSEKSKSDSLLNRWKKNSAVTETENEFLQKAKLAFQEILREFRLLVDKHTLVDFLKIEKKIQSLQGVSEYFKIREEVLAVIKGYLSRVNEEREEAASIIREIGRRLIAIESHFLDTVENARSMHSADMEFTIVLDEHLKDLRGSVDFSKTLVELKSAMLSKLNLLSAAIQKKREEDIKRKEIDDKRIEVMQKDLVKLQKEIVNANNHAEALEKELLTDSLTDIYNRRGYNKRIKEELNRFHRHNRPISVVLFDVDRFKTINDNYGHNVGDICLREIIKRVKPLIRESDFLARYGGEEFIVILPETNADGAYDVAEKLRKTVEQIEFIYKNSKVKITISAGITQINKNDTNEDIIFSRVDKAMYEAKNSGRNKVEKM